jgi:hypothetical protein
MRAAAKIPEFQSARFNCNQRGANRLAARTSKNKRRNCACTTPCRFVTRVLPTKSGSKMLWPFMAPSGREALFIPISPIGIRLAQWRRWGNSSPSISFDRGRPAGGRARTFRSGGPDDDPASSGMRDAIRQGPPKSPGRCLTFPFS